MDYNINNCIYHTNKTLSQVKQIGKDFGLKSKDLSSAKQVIRVLKPELACSMSLTDSLVKDGMDHKEMAAISKELAQPLFKKLMEAGYSFSKLINQ